MENKKLPKSDVDIRPLRTFQDDMAQAVERQNETAISMSVKESEKKQREGRKEEPKKKSSKKPLLYLSILFITLGAIALGFFFYQSQPKEDPVTVIDTIIIADKEVEVNTTNTNRASFIETVKSTDAGTVGTITNIRTNSSAQEFLNFLGARNPAAFERSLSGEMMFGLISLEGGPVPFWIVEVDSYENAFGSLLSWEGLMIEDLAEVFSKNGAPIDATFRDTLIKNKDVRILPGEELLYAFLDQNTLIITRGSETFEEILPLFISSKQIR